MPDPRDKAWEEWRKQERKDRGIEEALRRADEEARLYRIAMNDLVEKNAQDALTENLRIEREMSRGAEGGCGQSVDNLPR